MDERPYRVHVVVDPSYGDRIRSLPADEPAWVVDSAINHPAIQSARQERGEQNSFRSITSFKFAPDADREDWLIERLGDIDWHHGEISHDPPYSVLNIIGVPWSERIQRELSDLGFEIWETTSEGFISTRDLADNIR